MKDYTVRQPETGALEVDVAEGHDGVVVVTPRGRAGHREAEWLAGELARAMVLRPAHVVLDLSGVEFVSSVAAGVLVSFRHALLRRGTRVTVATPRRQRRHAGGFCQTRT